MESDSHSETASKDIWKELKTIQQKSYKNLDCFQACVNHLFNGSFNYVYLPMIFCWNFEYVKSTKGVGHGLQVESRFHINDFYRHYLQTNVQFYEDAFVRDRGKINEALIKNKKVVIGIDAFFCPWNLAYQKVHILHFIVVQSYIDETKSYVCSDPFVSDQDYLFLEDTLQMAYKNTRVFEVENLLKPIIINDQLLLTILCSNYKQAITKQKRVSCISSSFFNVANRIEQLNVWTDLFENNDLRLCELPRKIKLAVGIRCAIAYVLLSWGINSKNESFISLYKQFSHVIQQWEMAYLLVFKLGIRGQTDKSTVKQLIVCIRAIGRLEERLYEHIQRILDSFREHTI